MIAIMKQGLPGRKSCVLRKRWSRFCKRLYNYSEESFSLTHAIVNTLEKFKSFYRSPMSSFPARPHLSSSETRKFLKIPPGRFTSKTSPTYIQPLNWFNRIISSQNVTIILRQLTITPIASPSLPFVNLLLSLLSLFRLFTLSNFAVAISIGFNACLSFISSASLLQHWLTLNEVDVERRHALENWNKSHRRHICEALDWIIPTFVRSPTKYRWMDNM